MRSYTDLLQSTMVGCYSLYGEPDLQNFFSRAKNPYGQYGQHSHAPGQPMGLYGHLKALHLSQYSTLVHLARTML